MKKILLLLLLLPLCSQAQIITTAAGCGIGDDSVATKAELAGPLSVAIDNSGNTYIADQANYRIRKVNTAGVITTFAGNGNYGYSGDGGAAVSASLGTIYSVAVDKTGNVYFADGGFNVIRKINTSGIITTIAGTGTAAYSGDNGPAVSAELSGPSDVAADTSGNIFIADRGNYRVRKINTSGIITTVAGNGSGAATSGIGGPATAASVGTPFRITTDKRGNLYIAAYSDEHILKVTSGGILINIAGTGAYGYSGDNGPATNATFSAPCGIAVDTSGNVYFSDIDNNLIRQIEAVTGIIKVFAANGIAGYGGDGGIAGTARISSPEGLALDASGNLYIADLANNRIRKVGPRGTIDTITTFAGQNGLFGEGYAAVNAEISLPFNLACDVSGNVYFADYYNNRIRKINTATGFITTAAGDGIAGYADGFSGDGGPAIAAHIYGPTTVAVDAAGNIYVADAGNNRIRKVNTTGIITTIAGNGTGGFSGDGGPATAAEISSPYGIAVDNTGDIYIADAGNYRIRKINASGTISTVAGNGTYGFSGDGGPATAAEIYPSDVAIDTHGNLYIADDNNYIRKVDTTGMITSIAGTGTYGYTGDGGPAVNAELSGPGGLKVDGMGNIYFADYSNRVREIDTTGTIYTIAGNGNAGFSGDGGQAILAELNSPVGVAVDGSGNVYIGDGYNNRVRKVISILGVQTINKAAAWNVNVYPNPATNELNILATVKITVADICNLTGQTVATNEYNDTHVQIDISALPAGIYFVKINGTMTRKFVKE